MKKIGILNSEISRVISELGHTDQIVVCDAGFPIPSHVERIDLSLTPGVPSFQTTLEAVLIELKIEAVYFADEIKQANPTVLKQIEKAVGDVEKKSLPHVEFKKMSHQAKAVIRCGECTRYANVILQAGVIF
jgi:D-ribose pyranase